MPNMSGQNQDSESISDPPRVKKAACFWSAAWDNYKHGKQGARKQRQQKLLLEEDEDDLCGSKTVKTIEKTVYTTSCKLLMSNLFKLSFLMADNTEVLDGFLP